VRDVREYRIQTSKGEIVSGGSCFNVKAESLRLGNFSETEIRTLYDQHTATTGQVFEEPLCSKVVSLTGGQPWLVNALARELTSNMKNCRDRTRSIGIDDLDEAKERLIARRDTHIDQLVDKLKEPRVRRVIEPMLRSEDGLPSATQEDLMYVADLGLITLDGPDRARIANDIYREVIPRTLIFAVDYGLRGTLEDTAFRLPDNRLDFRGMLERFQQFYRQNSESWRSRAIYEDAAPQLLLQAWLQRVVNGGGHIVREYALGTGRSDIFVRYFYQVEGKRAEQRFVVEIKVVGAHHSVKTTVEEGLTQIARYADQCNPEEAHLVVVDPSTRTWDEKIYVKECTVPVGGSGTERAVTVWGM